MQRSWQGGSDAGEWDREGPREDVLDQAGVAAVMRYEDVLNFPPQRMVGQDAEVAADIGDDGADGSAADFGGDLLWGGQVGQRGAGFGVVARGRVGAARFPPRRSGSGPGLCRVQAGGATDDPGFERLDTLQATGDACEDLADIAGSEAVGGEARVGRPALLECDGEFLGVIDEFADEAEEAAGAAGLVRGGRIGIGLLRWGRDAGRVGHERNKNTIAGMVSRKIFRGLAMSGDELEAMAVSKCRLSGTERGIGVGTK